MASTVNLPDPPLMLQGVASPGYSAIELRRAIYSARPAQEGVYEATDYKVTPGAAAKTLSVAAGLAGILGDSVSDQGYYGQRNSSVQTLDLAAAPDATNPRIDQLVLEIKDTTHDASGLNIGRLRVISGTPSSGATLDSRSGAAALPATCLRLADILVPANYNAVFLQATHIRDRRPWARGAYRRIKRSQNASAGSDYTYSSSAANAIDPTNLSPRLELSGAPLRASLIGAGQSASTGYTTFDFRLNATLFEGSPFIGGVVNVVRDYTLVWNFPTAFFSGSGTVAPYWAAFPGGTATLFARAANPLILVVEEIVAGDTENSGA